jgi:hypothetical protein
MVGSLPAFCALAVPSAGDRADAIATPLSATIDQLRGLPDALLITTEVDVSAANYCLSFAPPGSSTIYKYS